MGLADSITVGTIVFVPLVLLLWFTLRKYAYPYTKYTYFDGQKIMMGIAGGMVLGLFITIAYRYFPLYMLGYAVIFAIIEELIRLVILNSPLFQMKFDATFYGAALGGGTATMIIAGIAYTSQTNPSIDFWNPGFLGALLAFSVSICLLNISNGAMIGYGCGKGIIWTYLLRAVIAHSAFGIALIFFLYPEDAGIFFYISIAAALAISIALYIYVYTNIIVNALPERLRKQRRREMLETARTVKSEKED